VGGDVGVVGGVVLGPGRDGFDAGEVPALGFEEGVEG